MTINQLKAKAFYDNDGYYIYLKDAENTFEELYNKISELEFENNELRELVKKKNQTIQDLNDFAHALV
ncbi:MAG: hypothetical protein PVF17_04415 [Ignavibacteria bacterium]|jgi:hypothetical protein